MGVGFWIGEAKGPAYERWDLEARAGATIDRRWHTLLLVMLTSGMQWDEVESVLTPAIAAAKKWVATATDAEIEDLAKQYPAAYEQFLEVQGPCRPTPP